MDWTRWQVTAVLCARTCAAVPAFSHLSLPGRANRSTRRALQPGVRQTRPRYSEASRVRRMRLFTKKVGALLDTPGGVMAE
jgi:hypothetical protein